MISIIKKWTASKDEKDFNYEEALKTLIKNKSIINQSIYDYLHFDFSNDEIQEKFEAVGNINQDSVNTILELINEYTYYLKMNEILKSPDDKNIKKLKQLNKIFDNDFIDFLDRYLYLDKTILSSGECLKIEENYEGAIKSYLEDDFRYSINELTKVLTKNTIRNDSIEIKDKNTINSLLIKPKTKAYLKPIGKRGILICLYFDLLYQYEEIKKEQAKKIIEEFFQIYFEKEKIKLKKNKQEFNVLQSIKAEHTLSVKTINFIKKDKNIYDLKGDTPIKIQNEIRKILNNKKFIKDNFTPIIITKDLN